MIKDNNKNLENFLRGKEFNFPIKKRHFNMIAISVLNFMIGIILLIIFLVENMNVFLYLSIIFLVLTIPMVLLPFYGSMRGSKLIINNKKVYFKRFFGKIEEFNWDEVEDVIIKKSYSSKPIVTTVESASLTRYAVMKKYLVYFKMKSGKTIKLNPNLYSWDDFIWSDFERKVPNKLLKAVYILMFFNELKKKET